MLRQAHNNPVRRMSNAFLAPALARTHLRTAWTPEKAAPPLREGADEGRCRGDDGASLKVEAPSWLACMLSNRGMTIREQTSLGCHKVKRMKS